MRSGRVAVIGCLVAAAAACGSGGLSEAEHTWCVAHQPIVMDTMDILYPYHWEGNEEAKEESLPIFDQMQDGRLTTEEGYALLAEITERYWPEEYERGCQKAYRER